MTAVLLVAATEPELCGHPGLACGIGPVEAAAAVARRLAEGDAEAVVHVGIAGGRELPLGAVVLGVEARYVDLRAAVPVVDRAEPAAWLLAAAARALPDAHVLPIATSAAVGASGDAQVEGMEGFGVLRVAGLAGVPAVEVRVISNGIGEDDRACWDIQGALARLAEIVPVLLAAAGR